MKKILILSWIVLLSIPAFSQIESRRRPFGITIGFSMKNVEWEDIDYWTGAVTHYKTDLFNYGYGNTLVSQLGFTIVPEFKSGVGIQTGLHFEFAMGYSSIFLGLQLPVRLQYRYEFPAGVSLLAFTGPNLYFGMYDDGGDLGNYWSFGAGVQYKGLQARVHTDMTVWQFGELRIRSPFTFSLSYLF